MWNNCEQSQVEEETISNAFLSRGLFKIIGEAVQSYPRVQATVQNKRTVIAVDRSIILLEDEMVPKCSFLSFEASIDVIAISQSGNLIVCGLSDGEVHGIFIKGIPLFNVCIKMEDVHASAGKTFVGIQQLEQYFYLSCSNGSVYKLSEIDETPLAANLNISISENENDAFDENMLGTISIQRLFTCRGWNELTAAILIPQIASSDVNEELLFIAGSHNAVHFRCATKQTAKVIVPKEYNGIKSIYNLENFIIALTGSGHLLQLCILSKLLYLPQLNDKAIPLIDELIVMECNDENIELLVLTKPLGNEERDIQIIEYPSFKCHNELNVAEHAWLVQQPKCAVNLYYLAGEHLNAANIPTKIEMMLVSETQPSERFKKLIAKGRLEEAEEFGVQFELCLQPIFEAKAKRALVVLASLSENNAEQLQQAFDDLLLLLRKLENREFFRNNRMITMPTRQILRKYLEEVLKHLNDDSDEYHILEITEQLHRLETLAIIDPNEIDMEWEKFVYHPNLIKMITMLFKTDMPTACLMWKRHSSAVMPRLNDDELRKLFGLIPNNTKAFHLVQWLRQFVPTVGNTHPDIMPFITEWSIEKTRALQYAEHWPEIGLEFARKVAEIFDEIKFLYSDGRRLHERNVVKLQDLVNALQDLYVLKERYNLVFTLDNYLQDSIDDTALYILQRVHLDKLQSLVNDFLYPIFQERGKSPVVAIGKYIQLLVASRNSFSTWLERAVACIELLHKEDDRLEYALLVLHNSPVPWPDSVAPLIKTRTSTHPLALKINTECELQVIKKMKIKYGWPADSAADAKLNLFVMRIVKANLPDMLDDIRVLTKAVPQMATSANCNFCFETVRCAKPEIAYELFRLLQMNKDTKSIAEIHEFFAHLLEHSLLPIDDKAFEQQKKFIEFFKLITPLACGDAQKRLLHVQNRFILRHKFRLSNGAISDLITLQSREQLLDTGIEHIIERSNAALNVSKFILSEICELCSALQMPKIHGVQRICQRMDCLPLTCALAYAMLEYDCTPENRNDFIELTLLLIAQQIAVTKQTASSSSALLFNEIDVLVFPLAHALLVRAALPKQTSHDHLELLKYVNVAASNYAHDSIEKYYKGKERDVNAQICTALDAANTSAGATHMNGTFEGKSTGNEKKRDSVSIFDNVGIQTQQQVEKVCHNNIDHMPIVLFVARTLLLMVTGTIPQNNLLLQLRNLVLQTELCTDSARNDFFVSLQPLFKHKLHHVWYTMARYLVDYQTQHQCNFISSDFISLQLRRVFKHVLAHKEVNFIELFSMLIADKHAELLLDQLCGEMKKDQQKVNLLMLAEMYKEHEHDTEHVSLMRAKRLKHYYYMEFCKQDASIRGKFNADIDDIDKLLKEFRNKQLDVQLLERLSRDFGLDYQQTLITQLISILHGQELQYEVKTDAFGDEEIVILSSVEHLRSLCQPYINEIKNTELITLKLKKFIGEINIYFYELYLCVIEILSYLNAVPKEMQVWVSILHFLKHKMITRRRNRPAQIEMDMWQQSKPEIGVLPKIARYRLPFKPIVEQPLKDILESELCVDNCESWFPLIQMHTILKGSNEVDKMRDYFCIIAVKNSIDEYKAKNETEKEAYHLQPTNNAFLKSILRLVKHVRNPSKAFVILHFVAHCAPDGADQVEATYECYKFALENEADITDPKLIDQLTKIKRKYPILKTQHLLNVYGLTDEKLLSLVEDPNELINRLYHHEIILKTTKVDINAVAAEIAQLHQLDVDRIQFLLLQKWLSFTMDNADGTVLDETLLDEHNLTLNASTNGDTNNATENVIRAHYILNSWPKNEAIQFLVAHIYPHEGSVNTSRQLQMYECFFKLNDGSASFSNMLNQQQYITIKCVHELKQLGHNYSLETFTTCNKIDILKKVWQRNTLNARTVKVLANICLGFDIYKTKIWNGLLKRMVMLNMVRELDALVDVLSSKPQLLYTEGLIAAWDCVLQHVFKNCNLTLTFEQEQLLQKTLARLQSCPVVHKLNLLQFAEQCLRYERPHIAAIAMVFCKDEEKCLTIKRLLSARRNTKLRRDILDLEDAGILSIILNTALNELDL